MGFWRPLLRSFARFLVLGRLVRRQTSTNVPAVTVGRKRLTQCPLSYHKRLSPVPLGKTARAMLKPPKVIQHKGKKGTPQTTPPTVSVPPPIPPGPPVFSVDLDDGDKFEGEVTLGPEGRLVRQGVGKYTRPDGTIFSGQWLNNELSGPLCFAISPAEGIQYRGGMRWGLYHGHGVYKGPSYHFDGEFFAGQLAGPGLLTDSVGRAWKAVKNDGACLRFELVTEETN